MSAPSAGLLVLSAGVEIVPVREFPADIRERVGGDPSDFILSDPTIRVGSQRIDALTANLLAQFVEPRRIVEAVVAHSSESGLDPSEVLQEAYPLVCELRSLGMLVDPADPRRQRTGPTWGADDEVGGYRIVRLASDLADTEVYEARSGAGESVALKYLRQDAPRSTREALGWEVRVLEHLSARSRACVPRLLEAKLGGEDAFIAMEWCEGERVFDLSRARQRDLEERGRVVRAVLDAYVALHAADVLHGDVHPGNVIVGRDLAVKLVDFGGARIGASDVPRRRIGLVPFYEPEVARAVVEDREPPAPTPLGEQYTVASLAYSLIARGSYLALSLETDRALEQILRDSPRPFAELGVTWPAVEEVLARALAKEPEARFPSFAEFADALRSALATTGTERTATRRAPAEHRRTGTERQRVLEEAATRLTNDYGLSAELTRTGYATGPTASIYGGAAGVAYALARIACLREEHEPLAAADVWTSHAYRERESRDAFHDGSVGSDKLPGPLALFHSETGLHLVSAVVRHVSADEPESLQAVEGFVRAARGAPRDGQATDSVLDAHALDATSGAASLLLGASALVPLCPRAEESPRKELLRLGADLADRVRSELTAVDPEPARPRYLGFAHGRSGALYSLLRWAEASGTAVDGVTEGLLDDLAGHAMDRGGGLAWPIEPGSDASPWTGWCHGSAGQVLTWSAAARLLGRQELRDLAAAAGRHIWAARGHSGPSLCCGGAGEALSLFVLARDTGDEIWVERGLELAAQAAREAPTLAHAQGLFRGEVGPGLVAAEALCPKTAAWPVCHSLA